MNVTTVVAALRALWFGSSLGKNLEHGERRGVHRRCYGFVVRDIAIEAGRGKGHVMRSAHAFLVRPSTSVILRTLKKNHARRGAR